MTLKLQISADPIKAALGALIDRHFDEAVATRGFAHNVGEMLRGEFADIALHGIHDIVETVGTTALGTRHLVISFGISDGFHRAFALAAKDLLGRRSH